MPGVITDADARYALDLVKTICAEVGPGLPGSPQERARAAIIRKELEAHLGTANVAIEGFTLAPDAFLGSLPVSGVLTLVAALLNISMGRFEGVSPWDTATAALAVSVVAVLVVVFEFVLSSELIDPLFRKKQSVNVIGTLRTPGAKDVKRLLIVSGHHDSALEMTWLHVLGRGFFVAAAVWAIGLVVMVGMSLLQVTGLLLDNAALVQLGTLGPVWLAFLIAPSIIYALFFSRGRKNGGNVPGAVDNLSACALAVAMCRFLVSNPATLPADTEIRFITFGSEEARLRGSRHYVARHLAELRRLDARLLNIEMVAYPEIAILTSDVNGVVKNSPTMVNSVVAAAERAGVPYTVKPASSGVGTDAASFSQAGLKATTLMPFKMPDQLVAFYHQASDGPEALTIEPLLNVLKLAVEWIRCGGEEAQAPVDKPGERTAKEALS